MRKYILPIIGLGVAAYFLLRRRTFASNLRYIIRDVALRGTLLSPKIQITIGIQNTSNQKAIVKSIAGSVYWNNAEFAKISKFETIEIKPNSETAFKFDAIPSALGVFQTVKDLIKQGLKNGVIKFEGTINVDNINVPLNIEKTV